MHSSFGPICINRHIWLRAFVLAGTILVTGKQFSDCLTDCVKVLTFLRCFKKMIQLHRTQFPASFSLWLSERVLFEKFDFFVESDSD